MTTPFQGSRLANLREKRPSQNEKPFQIKQPEPQLTLLEQEDTSYQPSISSQGGRAGTRFLKGRIQRQSNTEKNNPTHSQQQTYLPNKENNMQRKQSLKINQPIQGQFKLVLNDEPDFDIKKAQIKLPSQQPSQKRVLIQKKQEKQQPKPQVKQEIRPEVKQKAPLIEVQQKPILPKNNAQEAIKQQQVEQSKDGLQNQNELTQCPQGCGRKFNKKALQKHAKACKLVFMSKRKQFNSEAKRFTSQEQATLVKQNKLQEKKTQMGMTKGKGFDKTGDNWKAASQDFRSAIKAIKKEGVNDEGDQQLKTIACQYCQKPFAQLLLAKHIQNCPKRKEKELKQKKKATKKK